MHFSSHHLLYFGPKSKPRTKHGKLWCKFHIPLLRRIPVREKVLRKPGETDGRRAPLLYLVTAAEQQPFLPHSSPPPKSGGLNGICALSSCYSLGQLVVFFLCFLALLSPHKTLKQRCHVTPRTQEIPLSVDEILSTTITWKSIFKLHLSAKGENQFLLGVLSE